MNNKERHYLSSVMGASGTKLWQHYSIQSQFFSLEHGSKLYAHNGRRHLRKYFDDSN